MVTTVNTPALAGLLLRPAEWADTSGKSQPKVEDQQAAVVRISPEGARQAEAAAQAAPSTQQLQTQPDGDAGSQVTLQASKAPEPQAAATDGGNVSVARGAPPAGGGGAASSAASTSSTRQTYELADTNQDGQVSPMEETAYEARLAAEKQAKAEASAPRAAEAGAAVKAYEAVDQLGAAGG
ncbi:hypothetical protein ACS5PN_11260 [Roseateles sp. NT4]|uniref:hypothetical protein n=1 Tax=Roseateles sp. NT4 TaxID=3453715 RepID=UPI003EE9A870